MEACSLRKFHAKPLSSSRGASSSMRAAPCNPGNPSCTPRRAAMMANTTNEVPSRQPSAITPSSHASRACTTPSGTCPGLAVQAPPLASRIHVIAIYHLT